MSDINIFEYAVANKLRFPFKGMITVEDLYDLSVKDLDSIFKTLNKQKKQENEESLLTTKNKEDETLDVSIAIIKHVVNTKLEEKTAREKAQELRARKQKIMSIIDSKKNAELENSSIEDLEKMLSELD